MFFVLPVVTHSVPSLAARIATTIIVNKIISEIKD